MAVRHLTDKEIQEYVDGTLASEDSWMATHLEACDFCQEQLKQYENLFVALNQDVNCNLSARFSHSVLSKLTEGTEEAFHIGMIPILLSFFGLIIGIGLTLYFTGFKSLIELWTAIRGIQTHLNLAWISDIHNYIARLNLNFSLLGFALLIIIAIGTIDRFITRSKSKLASLFR